MLTRIASNVHKTDETTYPKAKQDIYDPSKQVSTRKTHQVTPNDMKQRCILLKPFDPYVNHKTKK